MTTDRRCLLQRLAFSELRHINRDILPTNTMAYDNELVAWDLLSKICPSCTYSISCPLGLGVLIPCFVAMNSAPKTEVLIVACFFDTYYDYDSGGNSGHNGGGDCGISGSGSSDMAMRQPWQR